MSNVIEIGTRIERQENKITISRGYSFGSTEQVTNTKLHTLVDSATISALVNADISAAAAIAESKINFDGTTVCKLADTQTISGNKTFANLTVINNLIGSLMSYPSARIGTVTTDLLIASLASINSLKLTSLTLGDTVTALSNLGSLASLANSVPTEYKIKTYVDGKINVAQAGDILRASADTERINETTSYTKIKEIQIPNSGTLRIKFDLKTTFGNSFGRVYKNGVEFGTEQVSSTGSYTSHSEDISGWTANDLCQVYCKGSDAVTDTYIKNFRIYENVVADYVVNTD